MMRQKDDLEIVKKTYMRRGLSIIIWAGMFELLLLFASALKNLKPPADVPSFFEPFLFSLIQLFPIFLFELGFYYVKNARRIKIANVDTKSAIDKFSLTFYRIKELFFSNIFFFILIFISILFLIAFVTVLPNEELAFSARTACTLGFFFSYFLFIRPFGIYLIRNRNKIKLDFLVNPAFWIGIAFLLFAGLSLHYVLYKESDVVLWILTFVFLLVGIFAIYGVFGEKYINYEFQNEYLILKLNALIKELKFTIPLNKIVECTKLTLIEEQALQESLGKEYVTLMKAGKRYIDFLRGKAPYPSKFMYGTSYPKVRLVGEDFDFIFSIKDANNFINQINEHKARLKK